MLEDLQKLVPQLLTPPYSYFLAIVVIVVFVLPALLDFQRKVMDLRLNLRECEIAKAHLEVEQLKLEIRSLQKQLGIPESVPAIPQLGGTVGRKRRTKSRVKGGSRQVQLSQEVIIATGWQRAGGTVADAVLRLVEVAMGFSGGVLTLLGLVMVTVLVQAIPIPRGTFLGYAGVAVVGVLCLWVYVSLRRFRLARKSRHSATGDAV